MLATFLIILGSLAGGFVTGLTGFGTGLTALIFWLQVVSPIVAAPLVVVCSIVGQLQTLPAIWPVIRWRRVMPFVIGGLLGVPIGIIFLPQIDVVVFKGLVGLLLISYCLVGLLGRLKLNTNASGPLADGLIGLGGGILGGLAGLSGPLPTIWASLKGWGKDEKRAVFQAFNLTILTFALAAQAVAGVITQEVVNWAVIALPGTLLGVWLGRKLYAKLGDGGFDKVVLIVLLLGGLMMFVRMIFDHLLITAGI